MSDECHVTLVRAEEERHVIRSHLKAASSDSEDFNRAGNCHVTDELTPWENYVPNRTKDKNEVFKEFFKEINNLNRIL